MGRDGGSVRGLPPPLSSPPIDPGALSTDDAWEQALAHGGEHVLKLADVALVRSTHPARRTGLSATLTAISQDA